MFKCISFAIFFAVFVHNLANAAQANFDQAKTLLRQHVYFDQNTQGDLYCRCQWDWRGRSGGSISSQNAAACGLDQSYQPTRAQRTEWEHVFAASNAANHFPCWREGGRGNCQKTNPTFNAMEADMHNLTPVVGSLNAVRSNYKWGLIPGEAREFGRCDFEVDRAQRVAEPPESARGMIARIKLYFADRYNIRLSSQQRQLFQSWNAIHPVTDWELERDRRIAKYQGWHNPYVLERARLGTVSPSNNVPQSTDVQAHQTAPPTDTEVVRGNRRSGVYHLASGCPSYHSISNANIVEFDNESNAIEAGFRKAGNCR